MCATCRVCIILPDAITQICACVQLAENNNIRAENSNKESVHGSEMSKSSWVPAQNVSSFLN
jgi:hypothetical protein